MVKHLAGSSARGAPSASLLIANLAHRLVQDTDWEYSEFSIYDLGQAVAHMTLEAQALGLFARQFRAFDREGLTAEFAVPAHWQITTLVAIGRAYVDERSRPSGQLSESSARERKAVADILWRLEAPSSAV